MRQAAEKVLFCPSAECTSLQPGKATRRTTKRKARLVLDTQCHDRVDYVVVVFFERLDGLLPGHVGLRHYQLDVLVLDALGVHLFALLLLLLLGYLVLVVVRVACVVVLRRLAGQLLRGRRLGAGVEVLDLGLAEDAALVISPRSGGGGTDSLRWP